jgi:membrane protein DedA with SNARE-associated domain
MLAAILVLASVTDSLADFATRVIDDLGLTGVFLLSVVESACVPIPSEPTLLFAGFAANDGAYSWVVAVIVASVANLIGSWIAYAVGFYGRLELFERQKFIHVSPKHLAWADRFFARHGDLAVFFGRMLPIVRTFISLPAGLARMPFWRFSVLTLLGAIPWNFALVLAGYLARDNWDDIKHYLNYVDYLIAAGIVAGAAYLLARWWQRRTRPAIDEA